MGQYQQLIINSATCSIVVSIPTATGQQVFQLLTVETFDFNDKSSGELIYAIGQADPIGNQSNENAYDLKITLQLGEMSALLQSCGFTSATQIRGAQIAVAALLGGFQKSYQFCNCNSDNSSIKAKDKQTLVTTDWMSIGL